jgi:formylglycine-generating enzyme required for sulfatase activity
MIRLTHICLFFCLLCFSSNLVYTQEHGTLIVSYSTGEKAERLDRVRFSLIAENGRAQELYPKGDAFIEGSDSESRLVVIENLPIGEYKLRFLIPNADKHFNDIPEKIINITKDKVVRIDQFIDNKESVEPIAQSLIRRPSGIFVINNYNAQLTVTSNQPNARWTLLRNGVAIYQGVGSVTNFQVLDGDDFNVVPEPLEGYTVRVSPDNFSIYPMQTMRVSIAYERSTGNFSIITPFPNGETLTFTLKSPNAPPATFRVKSIDGKIFWKSPPLPTGEYEVTFELPKNFAQIPSEKIFIQRGSNKQLTLQLFTKNSLRITTNVPEAIFSLTSQSDFRVWQGEGREYTFTDIPPGMYKISFSTRDPQYFVPPKEMKFYLGDRENKELKANFQMVGKLTIKTNIDRSRINIQEIGGLQKRYQDNIYNYSKDFALPEGRYRITLSSISEDKSTTVNFQSPDPVEINLKALSKEELNLNFHLNGTPSEKQRKLNVTLGLSSAGFTIYKVNKRGRELVGHYTGKNTQVTLPSADVFDIIFDTIPNYKTPDPATIEIKEGEEKTLLHEYVPIAALISIPAGRAIIGDAFSEEKINELPAKIVILSGFSIGSFEVTNAEFAEWLNKAIKAGTISYIHEGEKRGQILDSKGKLLFKTFEADAYSQIFAQQQTIGTPLFMPLAGKDFYPVINVTWYGALEYCKDNKCRLPTEAEWEKAAGMAREVENKPLRKYRFSFGRDEIDPTWANYKSNDNAIQYFKVLTTPVGFYNGINILPLSMTPYSQQKTNLAQSPYGAFDMSGNVWEWVLDWFDEDYIANMPEKNPQGPSEGEHKVAKGGCYDSLANGVRVTERMGLPPDYCDAYTGFRIAQ